MWTRPILLQNIRFPLHNLLNGVITYRPASDSMYYKETKVTATIAYEACYQFNGWTGSISGTQVTNNFTVQNDMTIAADVSVNNTPSVKETCNHCCRI